jgi:thiol:disulfide interchange protein
MRRLGLGLAVLAAVVIGPRAIGCGKTAVDLPIAWQHDYESGARLARVEHKPLILFFGAAWDCAWKEIEHETLTDRRVRTMLGRDFVTVHIDTTDDDEEPLSRAMMNRFRVIGDPTIIILGPDGESEILRFQEYVPADRFLVALAAARREDAAREARFEARRRER